MSLILHIETATSVCSIAVSQDEKLLSLNENTEGNSHSSVITNLIQKSVDDCQIKLTDLDAIAVSKGPGSYTGLRIGVSTAKGLCYSLDKPLIAINTLQAMAWGMSNLNPKTKDYPKDMLFCPMIDARRMEVYVAIYNQNNEEIRQTSADIVDEYSYTDILSKHHVTFGGNGSDKCRDILHSYPNALFLNNFQPSAKYMIILAENKYKKSAFENTAYFEPFYLKDFVAGKPKVKGLQ
jgi:tRNA threonylcarbamoyladenosine biosynthesis protein TsaB